MSDAPTPTGGTPKPPIGKGGLVVIIACGLLIALPCMFLILWFFSTIGT